MITPRFFNAAMVPANRRFVQAGAHFARLRLPVRWGLFQHPVAGWVMIDTGYTPAAVSAQGRSLGLRAYGAALRPQLLATGQPDAVLARLGLRPADIGLVIVTHFHADHVSGLRDFPQARFIAAYGAVRARGYLANMRHGVFAELLPPDFDARMADVAGLEVIERAGVRGGDMFGDGSVLTVPLPGHAKGHFGLLFPDLERPFLYAVDAAWVRAAIMQDAAPGFPARLISDDHAAGLETARRLRDFVAQGGEFGLCHDPAPMLYDGPAQ
ncbi:MBL fold metallo-hydrolase [Octadecabacter sp. R77987]|uniref:MBL fold metallo-hydrolase n=1 Tax=Octadecabacter sp. R77987 TaxID=3093874 RepID=UPI00366D0CD1